MQDPAPVRIRLDIGRSFPPSRGAGALLLDPGDDLAFMERQRRDPRHRCLCETWLVAISERAAARSHEAISLARSDRRRRAGCA